MLNVLFEGTLKWFPAMVKLHKPNTASTIQVHLPCVIDDDTPFSGLNHLRQLMLRICIVAVVLGPGVLGALWLGLGEQHVFTQLALFFGKTALLTFGGVYAMLPYMFDISVRHFHWLNTAQMLDGLALSESTPGLLIMVLTYIGFVAGWQAGLIGASIVTWFTFLPSFILVFLGAP